MNEPNQAQLSVDAARASAALGSMSSITSDDSLKGRVGLSEADSLFAVPWEDQEQLPLPELLIEETLNNGTLNIVYGPSGIGKTALMLHMARAVANGEEFCGRKAQQANVLLIDFEMGEQLLQTQAKKAGLRGPVKAFYNPESLESIQELIRQAARQGAGLVIIDSYSSLASLTGKDNAMNSNSVAEMVLSPLSRLAHELVIAIVILHHTNKGEQQYDGSQRIKSLADEIYKLKLNRLTRTLELSPEKHRLGNIQSLSIDAKDHPLVRRKDKAGDATQEADQEAARQAWLKAELKLGSKTTRDLEARFTETFEVGKRTLVRSLDNLVKSGELIAGKRGSSNVYSLASDLDRQTPPLNNPPVSVEDDRTPSSQAVCVPSSRQTEPLTA